MRFGVIVPSRGDRPGFIENCARLIYNQTIKPTIVSVVNFKPTDDQIDITKRYRIGYDSLRNFELDCIFLIEDDDWYSNNYFETMIYQWVKNGKPDLFGTSYTIYYNIFLKKYYTMYHTQRSSAMSTIIKPDMNFNWCKDSEPYTDSHLWFTAEHENGQKLSTIVFKPEQIICLGIKHGIGKTGGKSHTTDLHRYSGSTGKIDENSVFLKNLVDSESFNFYLNIVKNNTKTLQI